MKGTIGPEIMPLIVALVVLPLSLVVGYCHKWQYPNNHPLCHLWAIVLLLLQHKLAFCSSSKLTILRASSTQHSPSSVLTMLGPE